MDLTREALDREFPCRRSSIQMNHAAVAPLPARAVAAMEAYARLQAERGPLDWRQWGAKANELRGLAARLVGAREGSGGAASISIVPNTTWGLTLVAAGLDWREGDEVVTTATEFPANHAPWLGLSHRGVLVRRAETRDGAFDVGDIERLCGKRTRLVSVSAVAFHTGFVAPIAELGAFCRAHGILFGLDAIQAVGAVPIDVEGAHVDFLSADGHKWMLGPEGCGILFTAPELRARLRPFPGWINLKRPLGILRPEEPLTFVEDGTRFEPGALPTAGTYALAASVALLLEIGPGTVTARIGATLDALVRGLPSLGFTPILFDGRPRSGILAARPPAGQDARAYALALDALDIAVSAREGFVRFSPHVGNDPEEAERVLDALREAGP